jgi:hypothetical protein
MLMEKEVFAFLLTILVMDLNLDSSSLHAAVMGDDGLREEQTGLVPPAQWAVKLDPGNDANQVAQQHGFINLGPVANLKDYFLFEAGSHHTKRDTIERSVQVRDTVSEPCSSHSSRERFADDAQMRVYLPLCCRTWRTTLQCRGWRNR